MAVSQNLTLTELSYDVATNSSKVRILWTSTQTDDSYSNYTLNAYYWVAENSGVGQKFATTTTLPLRQTITILDKTITVVHNSDGTGSVRVETQIATGISAGTITKKAALTLTTIPRASKVSGGSGNIGEKVTINLTRYSNDFTHTLTYAFGDLSGTIVSNLKASSYADWTIPTNFYAQIPNAKSGKGTIYCKTYSGATQIGNTQSTEFTAYALESQCSPDLTVQIVDVNTATKALTGNDSVIIAGYSNVRISSSGTAKNSATIASYKTLCGDGKFINTASGTLNGVTSGSFSTTVTDSRGFKRSINTILPLVNYMPVTCVMQVTPVGSASGKATLDVQGNFFSGSFGQVNNTLSVQYRYRQDPGTYGDWIEITTGVSVESNKYSASIEIANLVYTNTYVFQVRVLDKLSTVVSNEVKSKTTPVFDWSEHDFRFNVEVQIAKKLKIANIDVDYIVAQGVSGDWIYRKWSSGVAECWCLHTDNNVSISIPWANLFESTRMGGLTYPSGLFSSPPVCTVQVQNAPQGAILSLEISGNNASATATPYWLYTRANEKAGINITVGVHAVGKWK